MQAVCIGGTRCHAAAIHCHARSLPRCKGDTESERGGMRAVRKRSEEGGHPILDKGLPMLVSAHSHVASAWAVLNHAATAREGLLGGGHQLTVEKHQQVNEKASAHREEHRQSHRERHQQASVRASADERKHQLTARSVGKVTVKGISRWMV
ncbi:uncharacterized protein SCHCODRAFT_02613847 [Schizophyllum commune H4-8]|uniref:uncharacterized protein n=1 Tax=Schizophyllum commune (strain H4-8 / FGSC 9210) TaxID=578458 RepID=UPI00215F9D25|nr:uncharacterized protein SCHCODRAFT_02613847 [Schizophyllum commune H4-8]KAI5896055.1 hypothetical protein SCHCODRAFT_02613847 [Schizophyllum commune H4-8]